MMNDHNYMAQEPEPSQGQFLKGMEEYMLLYKQSREKQMKPKVQNYEINNFSTNIASLYCIPETNTIYQLSLYKKYFLKKWEKIR